MNSFLAETIKRYAPVPDGEIEKFEMIMKPVTLARGDQFFGPGQSDRKLGFVQNGLFRFYYIDYEGKDATRAFIAEGGFLASRQALYGGMETSFTAEALEDSEVLVYETPIERLFDPTASHWTAFLMALMNERLKVKDKRIEGFILGDAKSRYLEFVEENPDLFSRIPHHHLASYLGVTPVTLSRIRKRVGHN